jgi:hypothetical protein
MRYLLFLALAACGAMQMKSSGSGLDDAIHDYNEGVKWGRYETASTFVPRPQRAARLDEWDEHDKDVKITNWTIVRVDRKSDREARVQIKLEWYLASENTVHETHEVQTWERHGHDWQVVDEARLRGKEMPGLPEPLMGKRAAQPVSSTP